MAAQRLLCALVLLCSFITSAISDFSRDPKDLKLLVITVATDETDGYQRFMKSCRHFNFNVKVLGMDQDWRGGDMMRGPGGGQKINIIKKETVKYKDDKNVLVMFVDSYDVIMLAPPEEIINKFLEFQAKMVVSAEGFCWPDRWLADKYPAIMHGKRYLCSGGIIGYAPVVHSVVTDSEVTDTYDDQLYYTKIYLDTKKRALYSMKLDHRAEIFMNLNGAQDEVEIKFNGAEVSLWNKEYGTAPLIAHGNGPSKVGTSAALHTLADFGRAKIFLNYLGNYLPKEWSVQDGCLTCDDNTFSLDNIQEKGYPKVTIALFVEQPTPFLPEFFQKIMNLDYPKKKIDLFLHSLEPHHNGEIKEWLSDETVGQYNSVKYIPPSDQVEEYYARNTAISQNLGATGGDQTEPGSFLRKVERGLGTRDLCLENKCDYLFVVDSSVSFTNNYTLKILIEQNRTVLSPKLSKHEKLWSNFWGAVSDDGFYERSSDYIDVVNGVRSGVWNVPFITASYLIKKEVLPKIKKSYGHARLDADMAFCQFMRNRGIFMYSTNLYYFGHLKEMDTYTTTHLHNDMWQIVDNKLDWDEKYLHPLYYTSYNTSKTVEQPCPDVYWFPLFKEIYATHLVEEMENFGQWSGGKNEDKRLSTGYENVPTVDIHMNQIGYEKEWLYFLKHYVAPLCHRVYPGYNSEARAIMNFVVKYNPAGQYYLRPHHDSSTYTINVALSKPGIDYGGGGCNFLRYNCRVTQTRVGWSFMHPGRLTHYHEGLPITWGTRYIMVSFIDP